jgi:hypothetical protein
MLQAKSLRRLIERFIVIWKVLFAWLKSIVRRTTMVPTPAPAAQLPRERFYGGEQKRARHRPVRCDEEAFVQVIVTKLGAVQVRQRFREQCTSRNHGVTGMFCKLGG